MRALQDTKIEPATRPRQLPKTGSSIALTAYEKREDHRDRSQCDRSIIGDVASNLFEAAAARVKSFEWQRKGGKSIG
jgi:hypothetical protein